MRSPLLPAAVLVTALATTAAANMGGSPPPEPTPPPQGEIRPNENLTARQQAEQLYGGAYDDVAKANKDLAGGKEKNAQKKLKHALERAADAVALDSTYYEAWNLVGYASRKLGDYPRSLAAYDRCLRIKPDYAPAREYLGEALVELGRVREARAQLTWLQRLSAADQATTLAARIDAWQAAHPDSAAPVAPAAQDGKPAPAAAPDTSAKAPGSGN